LAVIAAALVGLVVLQAMRVSHGRFELSSSDDGFGVVDTRTGDVYVRGRRDQSPPEERPLYRLWVRPEGK
jgi:hypothetical protein